MEWIIAIVAAVVGVLLGRAFTRKPKPKTQPNDVEFVETEPDAIEVIDDEPTPPVGPKLDPDDYPDDDPAVVDALSNWADGV